MRTLQILAAVICCLLAIIALQLRGLRPVTVADYMKVMENGNEAAMQNIYLRLPMVNVNSVDGRVDVEVKNSVDVDVKNKVSVTTGYVDFQKNYENEPLKVQIER